MFGKACHGFAATTPWRVDWQLCMEFGEIKLAKNDLQRVGKELIATGMLEPRDYGLFGLS